jgi:hypothetical protein
VSIIDNTTLIKIRRKVDVIFNRAVSYTIELNNAISQSGVPEEYVLTNGFYINSSNTPYYMDDDGLGNIRLFYLNPENYQKVIVNPNFGTIDYSIGKIVINSLLVTGIVETELDFILKPAPGNIYSKFNQIVEINSSYLTISTIQEISK